MAKPVCIRRNMAKPSADRGATSVEYALIASLIAVVILIGVVLLGTNVFSLFDETASSYSNAA